MAHNIHFNETTGNHSFFSTRVAWHKLGQIVSGAQNWEQAMQLAGLDWEVEKVQLTHPASGELINAWGTFRKDTGKFLGTVGSRYVPIQNKMQFDFVDALLEMEDGAHYETAGALGEGERVFCLAKLSDGFDLHGIGDRHEMYLLFTTAHDGRSSFVGVLTSVRVVCANTLQQALSRDGKKAMTIYHTKNAGQKLAQARQMIGAEKVTRNLLKEKMEVLSERRIRKADRDAIMARVFPVDDKTNKPTAQAKTAIDQILERYESNDNDAFPEIRGTAYNLLNAFTEYTDHHKPVRSSEARKELSDDQKRAEGATFGKGADFKTSVLDAILEQTKFCERRAIHRPLVSVPGAAATNVIEFEPVKQKSVLDNILDEREKAA